MNYVLTLVACNALTGLLYCVDQKPADVLKPFIYASDNKERRKREIYFKTVAIYKCGLGNQRCRNLLPQKSHPLINLGEKPYTHGDGGLLNPILKNYEVKTMPIQGDDFVGASVEVKGRVDADGIAAYDFDRTQQGHATPRVVKGSDYNYDYDSCYEMTMLEEAILGTLKERAADRGISDTSNRYFAPSSPKSFTGAFIETVKREWTSKQGENDSGVRSSQDEALIKRHMPRSAYWPSKWHEGKRAGEYERTSNLGAKSFDTVTGIELKEFEVYASPLEDDKEAQKEFGIGQTTGAPKQ